MRKKEQDWLEQKYCIEREMYQCFHDMMKICVKMKRLYKEIPQEMLQEYLTTGTVRSEQLLAQVDIRYASFVNNLEEYMDLKELFYRDSAALKALEREHAPGGDRAV